MPAQNLTDEQHDLRARLAAAADTGEGSRQLAAVIAAGPYHSDDPLHHLAYDAAQLHSRAVIAAHTDPRLAHAAALLGDVAQVLDAIAERAGV